MTYRQLFWQDERRVAENHDPVVFLPLLVTIVRILRFVFG